MSPTLATYAGSVIPKCFCERLDPGGWQSDNPESWTRRWGRKGIGILRNKANAVRHNALSLNNLDPSMLQETNPREGAGHECGRWAMSPARPGIFTSRPRVERLLGPFPDRSILPAGASSSGGYVKLHGAPPRSGDQETEGPAIPGEADDLAWERGEIVPDHGATLAMTVMHPSRRVRVGLFLATMALASSPAGMSVLAQGQPGSLPPRDGPLAPRRGPRVLPHTPGVARGAGGGRADGGQPRGVCLRRPGTAVRRREPRLPDRAGRRSAAGRPHRPARGLGTATGGWTTAPSSPKA